MSTITTNFLNSIGRYSILYVIAAPIYIFAKKAYLDENGEIVVPKLAIAILLTFVIFSTLIYWKNPKKNLTWQKIDRLTASSIVILTFIFGNNNAKAFSGAAVYFYLIGHSGGFRNYNSFINHIVFRFFAGLGILMYIVQEELYNKLFVLLNVLVVLGLIFLNLKKLRHSRTYNRGEEIRESILIF